LHGQCAVRSAAVASEPLPEFDQRLSRRLRLAHARLVANYLTEAGQRRARLLRLRRPGLGAHHRLGTAQKDLAHGDLDHGPRRLAELACRSQGLPGKARDKPGKTGENKASVNKG
jgi:hypothetical protein